jgi:hypothetical protein
MLSPLRLDTPEGEGIELTTLDAENPIDEAPPETYAINITNEKVFNCFKSRICKISFFVLATSFGALSGYFLAKNTCQSPLHCSIKIPETTLVGGLISLTISMIFYALFTVKKETLHRYVRF